MVTSTNRVQHHQSQWESCGRWGFCLFLLTNEFTIDDDDLVGSPSQTARIVHSNCACCSSSGRRFHRTP